MASITLRYPKANQRQTVNIELQKNVKELKNITSTVLAPNNDWSKFDISFCGTILEDGKTLISYGVEEGDILHILEKPKPKGLRVKKLVTDADMVQVFRTLPMLAGYKNALAKLSNKEVLDKIIEATPGLIDEPAAIALLKDPELLTHLLDIDSSTKITKEYPVFVQVIQSLINYTKGEQADTMNQASTSTGYSYSLDALSDDEEDMDSSETMLSNPLTRNSSFNAVTAAQLAAAIANATNTNFDTNSAGMPNTVITNEMFSSAMLQANSALSAMNPPNRSNDDSDAALTRRWETQLHQMHEMGLINDTMNLRALRATSGEVTSAIEIVLTMAPENDRL